MGVDDFFIEDLNLFTFVDGHVVLLYSQHILVYDFIVGESQAVNAFFVLFIFFLGAA